MLELLPLPSLLYIYVCGSLRFSTYTYVVCLKGKERPLGELKATFSTALKVLQCSKTIADRANGSPPSILAPSSCTATECTP